MITIQLDMLGGMGLFALGLYAALSVSHLLRKILALQVMGSGVFMVLVALGHPRIAGGRDGSCRSSAAGTRPNRDRRIRQRDGLGFGLPVSRGNGPDRAS